MIGTGDQLNVVSTSGKSLKTIKLNGMIRKIIQTLDDSLYVYTETKEKGIPCLEKLSLSTGMVESFMELSTGVMDLFPFEDGFACVSADAVRFFHYQTEDSMDLIDICQQSLLASEVKFLFGSQNEIKLVSIGSGQNGCLITFSVPKNYVYQIEFHAKKYNQLCEDYYVEIELYEDTIEDYLGKGNRLGILMFADQTELDEYIQKGVLVDFLPIYEQQETYFIDGVSMRIRELYCRKKGERCGFP